MIFLGVDDKANSNDASHFALTCTRTHKPNPLPSLSGTLCLCISFTLTPGCLAHTCLPHSDRYANGTWFIQQQMAIEYLPNGFEHCVYAKYTILPKPTFLGYNIDVHNHAENASGAEPSGVKDICSQIVNGTAGKLRVAPCFVPAALAGPYWVVAYDQAGGWALVSGGPPTVDGDNGKCKTGTGINGSGLWIFTRQQARDDKLVNSIRLVANNLGFDLSVLKDVNQTGCNHQ